MSVLDHLRVNNEHKKRQVFTYFEIVLFSQINQNNVIQKKNCLDDL